LPGKVISIRGLDEKAIKKYFAASQKWPGTYGLGSGKRTCTDFLTEALRAGGLPIEAATWWPSKTLGSFEGRLLDAISKLQRGSR